MSKHEWQPIETAPKDGRRFIGWDSRNHKMLFTMHWDGGEFLTDYESWSGHASLWMPLPEPPGKGEADWTGYDQRASHD